MFQPNQRINIRYMCRTCFNHFHNFFLYLFSFISFYVNSFHIHIYLFRCRSNKKLFISCCSFNFKICLLFNVFSLYLCSKCVIYPLLLWRRMMLVIVVVLFYVIDLNLCVPEFKIVTLSYIFDLPTLLSMIKFQIC